MSLDHKSSQSEAVGLPFTLRFTHVISCSLVNTQQVLSLLNILNNHNNTGNNNNDIIYSTRNACMILLTCNLTLTVLIS